MQLKTFQRNCDRAWGRAAFAVALFGMAMQAQAQWQMQAAGTTTVSLRGIHALSAQVAWASGANGTVLRTMDGGQRWEACSVPPDAGKLDFRSIWAWDSQHAMAMSSGPGGQSRLYSTHDGCQTWRLVFTNPDPDGFWDALQFDGVRFGVILGDPVHGMFTLFVTYDGGTHWTRQLDSCLRTVAPKQGAFAASNQALAVLPLDDASSQPGPVANHQIWFGTSGGWLYGLQLTPLQLIADGETGCTHLRVLAESDGQMNDATTGIFAVAFREGVEGVAVGGDYAKPHDASDNVAYTLDGSHWQRSARPPAGYRSAVAWNSSDGSWLAVGPGGSDTSHDGGKTWQPLGPEKRNLENWNALSLPFAVGTDGRIGRLISWGQLHTANRMASPRAFLSQRN